MMNERELKFKKVKKKNLREKHYIGQRERIKIVGQNRLNIFLYIFQRFLFPPSITFSE